MFSDFNSGQLDISDWPIQPADLAGFLGNPDFFVSSRQGDFGIFQLDMNHQTPLLTIPWQIARSTVGGTTPANTGSPAYSQGTPSIVITSTCLIPCPGFPLVSDSHIKFVANPMASTPNSPGTWVPGDPVIYDVDGDGIYNDPGTPPDTVISGSGVPFSATLSIDPKIKFIDDFSTNGIWNVGESVVYDSNNSNVFNTGETVIAQPTSHFDLLVHLKNFEENSALVKDPNNLVVVSITGQSVPTASMSDNGNPSPSGTYGGSWGFGLSNLPSSFTISTSIYSGSATLFTSGSTAPVCQVFQQCTADLTINYNSPSTLKPTVAGIEISRGLGHLIDKPNYLSGSYLTPAGGSPLADCDDVQTAPAQGLMIAVGTGACNHNSTPDSSTINGDCGEHTWFTPCAPISLYHVSGNSPPCTGTVTSSCPVPGLNLFSVIGYSGVTDLHAACDHFEDAGFHDTGPGGTGNCAGVALGTYHLVNPSGSCTSSTGVGCIILYVRTDLPRRAFGQIIGDTLNFLFGTPAPSGGTVCYGGPPSFPCVLSPAPPSTGYFTISQVTTVVFTATAGWNLYTGGFSLGSTPDHLYSLYHSQFSGSNCGGPNTRLPNNYPIYCDPLFDTQANSGEFGIGLPAFVRAAALGATRGATLPVYSGENQFVALNAWNWQQVAAGTGGSLVAVKGHGFEAGSGLFTTLNMRPIPGYTPSSSLYYASGCNPSSGCQQNIIRRSMAQTTLHMTPWTFTTVWEAEPLTQVYDSMLNVDPNTQGLCQTQPGGTAHCIDWMTTSHSISFNSATNQATQTWNLRSDIYWHDGQAVTAHDVCFSILSYKAAPSANFLPSVADVVSCTAVSSKIVQVTLNGNSPFDELNIGGVFIVPEHVWAPVCGGLVAGTDSCVNPTNLASPTPTIGGVATDPVAAGYLIGSGPWICNYSVGVSTISGQKSCTQNADGSAGGQALSVNGRMLLKRDLGHMRCCADIQQPENTLSTTNLQALEWADFNKDGRVTILDIAAAASHFGSYDPYFASPVYGVSTYNATKPNGGFVDDIGDIATIAFYLDHGITSPFLGTHNGYLSATQGVLNQLDPVTDPYDLTVQGVQNAAYGNGVADNWGTGTSGTASVSGMGIILQSTGGIPAGASYSAMIVSAPSGAPLNPCTAGGATFSDGSFGPKTLSFPSATSGPTPLQFNFGHCFPSGTYVFQVSYTPPGGVAAVFWTLKVVKP